MRDLNFLDWIVIILVVIGGLNWGLIGFFNFNLVEAVFGTGTFVRIVYALVGIAAIYFAVLSSSLRRRD